jgi:hypothetical protein
MRARPRAGHTISAWGALLAALGVALIIGFGLVAHATVCVAPAKEHPFLWFFCEFRRMGVLVDGMTLLLLLMVLIFAAEYDEALEGRRDDGSAPRKIFPRPIHGARAVWRNKGTPHRLKTVWTAIGFVLLTGLFYYIVSHAEIAF